MSCRKLKAEFSVAQFSVREIIKNLQIYQTMNSSLPILRSSNVLKRFAYAALVVPVACAFVAGSGIARADIHDPPAAAYGPTRKLGRGLNNIALSPLELPYQISKVNNKDGGSAAATFGVVKGSSLAIKRLAFGLYETLTFPFPLYKGSYRVPYKLEHRWVNGGIKEFSPQMGGETQYPHIRIP